MKAEEIDEILQHHGVKGMKWGVTRGVFANSTVGVRKVLELLKTKTKENTDKWDKVKTIKKDKAWASKSTKNAKGMKWGVVRWRKNVKRRKEKRKETIKEIKDKVKKGTISRSDARKAKLDAYHESKSKYGLYSVKYDSKISKGRSHYSAVKSARRETRTALAMASTQLGISAIFSGRSYIIKAYNAATDPKLVRAGKNLWLAAKRSPIRYVDGTKMTNAINVGYTMLLKQGGIQVNTLDELLKHDGVKGMKWGVVRWRKPGGKSGNTRPGRMKQEWNSLKRERHWNKVMKDFDKLTTTEVASVSRRLQLENELKRLSKSNVAKGSDKKNYRLREGMADDELNQIVGRLRAKNALNSQANEASKGQREFGKRVVQTGGSILMKYALSKNLSPGDIYESVSNPKAAKTQAIKMLLDATIRKSVPKRKLLN